MCNVYLTTLTTTYLYIYIYIYNIGNTVTPLHQVNDHIRNIIYTMFIIISIKFRMLKNKIISYIYTGKEKNQCNCVTRVFNRYQYAEMKCYIFKNDV